MAQDNKSNLPPIEDLGRPEFIQDIVSKAMNGKTASPSAVRLGVPLVLNRALPFATSLLLEQS